MENASKALIIAGAILLAIVIIGIGVVMVNQSSEKINSPQLDSQEIETYNSKFQHYEGTKRGSDVRALIGTVRNANNSPEAATKGTISVKYVEGSTTNPGVSDTAGLGTLKNNIVTTNSYSVVITELNENGYVSEITITKK